MFMKPFEGVVIDFGSRIRHYRSDFTDAKHRKTISSSFYMFFACLANAVAFGSLSSTVTNGQIGVVEMLVATAIGGTLYALLSAQPITLIGGTGPIVIFTSLLFVICKQMGLEFISVYAWCGIWTSAFLIIFATFNTSALMRFFSRFTDDIFSALVSIIFIVEASKNIFSPIVNGEGLPIAAWYGVGLAFGTVGIALGIREYAKLNPSKIIWRILADFAPTIAIIGMTAWALMFLTVPIVGPAVPEIASITTSGRPWLVNLFDVPGWIVIGAMIPAFFAATLLFLDQNITSRIINESDAPMVKGHGYHLDLLVIGVLTLGLSLFGLPWIVAATVHSVNHLSSLTVDSFEADKPPIAVIETRASALIVHIAIAISLLFLPYVQLIPMPVLFGLFVYMGVVSLQGNAFFIRSISLLTPPIVKQFATGDNQASRIGSRRYTLVQGACFSVLWIVKSSIVGILFPIFIALCVPVRMLMAKYIDDEDLDRLDDYDP
jgi:hypothetical protein